MAVCASKTTVFTYQNTRCHNRKITKVIRLDREQGRWTSDEKEYSCSTKKGESADDLSNMTYSRRRLLSRIA